MPTCADERWRNDGVVNIAGLTEQQRQIKASSKNLPALFSPSVLTALIDCSHRMRPPPSSSLRSRHIITNPHRANSPSRWPSLGTKVQGETETNRIHIPFILYEAAIRDRLCIHNYKSQKKCPQKCSPSETCINAVSDSNSLK